MSQEPGTPAGTPPETDPGEVPTAVTGSAGAAASGPTADHESALAARERAVAARERAQDAAQVARQRTGEFPAVPAPGAAPSAADAPGPSPAAASASEPGPPVVPDPAPSVPVAGPEPVAPATGPAADPDLTPRERAAAAAAIARERSAEWRERTGELASDAGDRLQSGASVAREQAGRAASATAQAVRQTDVGEIARSTNTLVERTRPFFLIVVAVIFTILALIEGTARVAVIFAVGGVLSALAAAFGTPLEGLLRRGGSHRD